MPKVVGLRLEPRQTGSLAPALSHSRWQPDCRLQSLALRTGSKIPWSKKKVAHTVCKFPHGKWD